MLKEFLVEKGINPVEVEQLTKPEVVPQVRTLTFRVAVKAGEYEAALKPEIWPYRVGVRHYRPARRSDRPEAGWQGQSGRTGGHVNAEHGGAQRGNQGSNQGNQGSNRRFPPGHPTRAGQQQQFMGPRQPGPVEVSNFWNLLSSLGGEMGLPNQQNGS